MSCYDFNIDYAPNCGQIPNRERMTMAFVKKGMARKAFLKYLETSDLKNIQRQIDKGIVKIIL